MRWHLGSLAFLVVAVGCTHAASPPASKTTTSSSTSTAGAAEQDDDDPSAPPKSAAKLTEDQAKATALAKVPGDVVASELEREHGHLIYSIEIKPTGQTEGVKEVNVDAIDGSIVNIEDEHDEDEGDAKEGDGDHD